MRLFALTTLLIMILAASVAGQTISARASSHSPGNPPVNLVDGRTSTTWWSMLHQAPDYPEFFEIELSSSRSIQGLTLRPLLHGKGFPRAVRIEYGYDDNRSIWFPVPAQTLQFEQPSSDESIAIQFPGPVVAKRLRVTATELGSGTTGLHAFQLAECEPIYSETLMPFATSVGGDFDARLNMMWLIFGSISDGTNAVYDFGSEPAYQEWMALKYLWSQSTADHSTRLKEYLQSWPISNDGYLWSWGDQEKWPTGDHSFHQENNAKYILACWRYWCWTRDDAFFDYMPNTSRTAKKGAVREGMRDISDTLTIREKLRLAMKYFEVELKGNRGDILVQDNGMGNTGTVDGDPSNYWDNFKFGYKNAYDNIYYYAALEAMAQLEDEWGDHDRAAQLRKWREGHRKEYNELFWDEEKGRYIGTIDKEGNSWDFGFTFLNTEAIAYGLADKEKAQLIYDWLDGKRIVKGDTSTGKDIYHFGFAPRSTTLAVEKYGPPYWWKSLHGAIRVDNPTARFGNHLENGGAIFYTSYYDLMGRLKHLGQGNAIGRLNGILDEFQHDQLRRDPAAPESAPWMIGVIGEFPESGLVPCFVTHGLAGITADREGLHVSPQMPRAWSFLTINQVSYAGAVLDIRIEQEHATIANISGTAVNLLAGEFLLHSGDKVTIPIGAEGIILKPVK